MSMKILFVALLLLTVCRGIVDSSAAHYPTGKNRPCCVEVTSNERDRSREVIGNTYSVQHARRYCVHAIIFNTLKGPLCVDPNASWVQIRIRNMKKEN